MLPLLYERWLEGLSRGEEEPPIAPNDFHRLGTEKRSEFISALGFSEHLTECMIERLLEDAAFERAIYHLIDGSGEIGKQKVLNAISRLTFTVLSKASDALQIVLDDLEWEK